MTIKRTHLGGCLILALLIGAFFLPSLTAQAAAMTTYNRTLPARTLVNGTPMILLASSFTTNRRGILSLRTIQQAGLGTSGPGRYSGGTDDLTITVTLDTVVIDTVEIKPIRYTDPTIQNLRGRTPLTPIGIFTTHSIPIGRHMLSLSYTSSYSGISAACGTTGHAPCPGARISQGRSVLVTPNRS